MASELLPFLLKANLTLAAAVLLVLALRKPVRAAFGARSAYALWLVVPLSILALLIPARTITLPAPVATKSVAVAQAPAPAVTALKPVPKPMRILPIAEIALGLWLAVTLGALAIQAERQRRFVRSLGKLSATDGLFWSDRPGVGPAVIGALAPRVVLPADFAARFSPEEQALILAHEQNHLAVGDAQINAAVTALQCLFWFNPLIHLGAAVLRVDQEIACDAAVVERHPDAARLYAQTLLGSALTPLSAPFGCHWPAVGVHPLKERLTMLQTTSTSPARKTLGALLVGTLGLAAAGAVWAANAPEPTIRMPIWTQRPGGEDMARYYPEAAHAAGVTAARVLIDCAITAEGRLENCLVARRTPPSTALARRRSSWPATSRWRPRIATANQRPVG